MSDLATSITLNSIIQGVLAMIALSGTFLLVINNREIPAPVTLLDGAIISFYFSTVLVDTAIKKNNRNNGV